MRVDVDDHGPPLEFARELDLIDELNSYLNSPKQLELLLDTPDPSPIDSPIIDILPPPELIPVSYSVDPEGNAECEDETSSTPLFLSAHANISPEYCADPTPPYIFPDSRLDHCEHLNCMKSTIVIKGLRSLNYQK